MAPQSLSGAEVLERVGVPDGEAPVVVSLTSRVALLVALRDECHLALHWATFARPVTVDGVPDVEVVVVATAPVAECGRMLHVAGRLRAGLADAATYERAVAARTREDLVRALAGLDDRVVESVLTEDDALRVLGTARSGLATAEARRRLAAVGPNRLERVRRRPLALRLLEQFTSFFAILLWVAGGLAFLAGMGELGAAVFVVIVVNGLGSFLQEYRAERAIAALEDLLPHEVVVLRAGAAVRVPARDLVPGDVIRLGEGDQVPADGRVLVADGLRIDQAALTGESHPIFKLPARDGHREQVPPFERHELLFAGTAVVAGAGTAVVTASGMHTAIGEVARLTQAVAEEPSPLQREMVRVTRLVTLIAVSCGVAFFALGLGTGILAPAAGFVFALGVIVANVPEGLLPTLTLALALGARRLARLGSLVKRLSAVETLGAATVICTDKTGTLTEGRMTARALWAGGRVWGADDPAAWATADVRRLLEAAVLASLATRDHGDPTEVGLVRAADAAGVDAEKLRAAAVPCVVHPFDSFRKRMSIVRREPDGAGPVAYVKGAPRETVALCTAIRRHDAVVPLSDDGRRAVLAEHDRLAADGLRLLAVAERAVDGTAEAEVERDLTLLGFVALWDPPRPEVPAAIARCRGAGIRVTMITGDYGLTARAIATRIGLDVRKIVTGEELERLRPEMLRRLLREPGVLFARTSPAHKLAVVEALRGLGDTVAVTGDGVNDAPALKAADIGVAMGQRGTDVAREAADMVVTDDNFASIVVAVEQGRAIYANMGKFVTYIFASNVPELVPFLAFAFFGIPLPLTVMQILAVDLGTDLVPALALGAEPPEPGLMDRPPRRRDARLLDARRLLRAYAFLGVIEAVLALAGFFWVYWLAGWTPGHPMDAAGDLYHRATTMTLAGIVAAQVGNVFACRTDRASVLRAGVAANRLVFAGVAVEIAVLVALIEVPWLATVFGLAPLAPVEWAPLVVMPFVVLAFEEGRKWVVRATTPAGGR